MIKIFENFLTRNKYTYYQIYVNGSVNKFDAALFKLGLYDDFYDEWDVKYTDDIKNKKLKYIYLVVFYNNFYSFYLFEDFEKVVNFISIGSEYEYGGEIRATKKDIEKVNIWKNVLSTSKNYNL